MVENTICNSCGYTSVPKGARFCPHCGANLTSSVPMAAAIPIENEIPVPTVSVANAPTSSNPNPHQSDSIFTYDTPSSAAPTFTTVNETANLNLSHPTNEDDKTNMEMAVYWKQPSAEIMQRAARSSHSAVGGILFIESSGPKGKFILGKDIHVGQVLHGTKIDLSIADFIHPVTTINVGSVLGDLKLIVPRGVRVETRGIGILGMFRGVDTQTVHAGQDAPLVVLQGISILASVKVRVNMDVPPVRVIP